MSTLLSIASGDSDEATTWGLCDSTAELDSEAGATSISTTPLDTATFTPGAITVEGIALKLSSSAFAAAGTFTVTLRNSTAGSDVTSVTVNITDLGLYIGKGWVYFKFATPQLLLAATAYLVRVVCSNTGSQVTLYRNATANNWSRQLVTSTTQAPVSGDKLLICGSLTGAGTGNNVQVDLVGEDGSKTYGSVAFATSIGVGMRGTLKFPTTAATTTTLKIAGLFEIGRNGVVNIGEALTPIPNDSTVTIQFDLTANVDSGIQLRGGTLTTYGKDKKSWTVLTANRTSGGAVLTVADTTGWEVGDTLAITSTSRSITEMETKVIQTVDSATQVTLTTNVANAHAGTGVLVAEVMNLNRNIKIFGESASLQAFIYIYNPILCDINDVEFKWMGSGTSTKNGIYIDSGFNTGVGAVSIKNSSLYDFIVTSSQGFYLSSPHDVTIQDCVTYNIHSTHCYISSSSLSTLSPIVINNNCFCKNVNTGNYIVQMQGSPRTFTNNRISGNANSNGFQQGVSLESEDNLITDWSGNVIHSNGGGGIFVQGSVQGTLGTTSVIRNNGDGLKLGLTKGETVFDSWTLHGNSIYNVDISGDSGGDVTGDFTFKDCAFDTDATYTVNYGLNFASTSGHIYSKMIFDNCTFGATVAHSGACIRFNGGTTAYQLVNMYFRNCLLSGTVLNSVPLTNANESSFVSFQNYNRSATDHRTYRRWGVVKTDTAIYNTASPSMLMEPFSSTIKLTSHPSGRGWKVPVQAGHSITASVAIRKSTTGDHNRELFITTNVVYNGAQPRLMVRRNPSAGILSDTVVATYSAAAGSWNVISGTTAVSSNNTVLEFYVDCDGTEGYINVDDFGAF